MEDEIIYQLLKERGEEPSLDFNPDEVFKMDEEAEMDVLPTLLSHSSSGSNRSRSSKNRKRKNKEDILGRIHELTTENSQLAQTLQELQRDREMKERAKQDAQRKVLRLIQQGASEGEVADAMAEFTEYYTDFGKSRRGEVMFHLQQLSKRVRIQPTTKVCLWLVGAHSGLLKTKDEVGRLFRIEEEEGEEEGEQEEQEEQEGKEDRIRRLMDELCVELELSQEQIHQIRNHSDDVKSLSKDFHDSTLLLNDLISIVETKYREFGRKMERLQEILTPEQAGKFLIWSENMESRLNSLLPSSSSSSTLDLSSFSPSLQPSLTESSIQPPSTLGMG